MNGINLNEYLNEYPEPIQKRMLECREDLEYLLAVCMKACDGLRQEQTERLAANPSNPDFLELGDSFTQLTYYLPRAIVASFARIVRDQLEEEKKIEKALEQMKQRQSQLEKEEGMIMYLKLDDPI